MGEGPGWWFLCITCGGVTQFTRAWCHYWYCKWIVIVSVRCFALSDGFSFVSSDNSNTFYPIIMSPSAHLHHSLQALSHSSTYLTGFQRALRNTQLLVPCTIILSILSVQPVDGKSLSKKTNKQTPPRYTMSQWGHCLQYATPSPAEELRQLQFRF